ALPTGNCSTPSESSAAKTSAPAKPLQRFPPVKYARPVVPEQNHAAAKAALRNQPSRPPDQSPEWFAALIDVGKQGKRPDGQPALGYQHSWQAADLPQTA